MFKRRKVDSHILKRACKLSLIVAIGMSFSQAANDNYKKGFVTQLGLSQMYLLHNNGVANVETNPTLLNMMFSYVFQSGSYIKSQLDIGFGNGYARGAAFFAGGQALDNIGLRGAISIYINSNLLFAYNILNDDFVLLIESGIVNENYGHQGLLRSTSPYLNLYSIPIFLRGVRDIDEKASFEYGIGASFYSGNLMVTTPYADPTSQNIDGNMYGIGIGFDAAFLYAINKNISIYTKLFSKYFYLSQSNSKIITNTKVSNMQNNNVQSSIAKNGSATIFYPDSHTFVSGFEIGFRY